MEFLKQKLSSRKLWAAIIAAASAIVAAIFGDQLTPEIVDAIVTVTRAAIAYIFGEGAVDIARIIAAAMKANGLPAQKPDAGEPIAEEESDVVIRFEE